MGGFAGNGFVVVTGVVVATEAAPVFRHDLGNAAASLGQDLQPEQHGPESVFLAHVVAAGAETFFTAKGDLTRIQQVAEELPTGGSFKAVDAQFFCDHIHCGAGGHGAGYTSKPVGIGRGQGGVRGENGQAVAGIHEAMPTQDHVAVAISVAGCTEAVVISLEQ